MNSLSTAVLFLLGCVLAENIVLVRMMGATPLLQRAGSLKSAALLGLVTALVMTLTTPLCWMAQAYILAPWGAEYLQYVVYVAVILAVSALCVKLLSQKLAGLQDALAAIACNCAVLGSAICSVRQASSLGRALLSGLGAGLGFLLAIVLMAGVQERIATSHVPERLKGFPISLICAGLMALAFMGFIGIG